MDPLCSQKDNLIERLLDITSRLYTSFDSKSDSEVDSVLQERAHLLSRLESMGWKPSPEDRNWYKKLQQLQNLDALLAQRMSASLQNLNREIRIQTTNKINLIRHEFINPKGHELEIKA